MLSFSCKSWNPVCYFFKFTYLFLGCAGSSLLRVGFLWVAASGGYALVAVLGLLPAAASLVAEHGLSAWASLVGLTGFTAQWHVGSSQTRDQTCTVPCISRWLLNHWATREILCVFYTYSGPQFRLAVFYVLDNLMWLVVTWLDGEPRKNKITWFLTFADSSLISVWAGNQWFS